MFFNIDISSLIFTIISLLFIFYCAYFVFNNISVAYKSYDNGRCCEYINNTFKHLTVKNYCIYDKYFIWRYVVEY